MRGGWARSATHVPIIFLTARDATEDKVRGLTMGGDDYVTKPFSLEELVARIRTILRRAGLSEPDSGRLVFEDLELDEETREVSRGGNPIELSATEYRLLHYMMLNPRRVLTRSQILDHVWDYDFGGDARVLETYVSYLRKKLNPHGLPADPHGARRRLRAARRQRTERVAARPADARDCSRSRRSACSWPARSPMPSRSRSRGPCRPAGARGAAERVAQLDERGVNVPGYEGDRGHDRGPPGTGGISPAGAAVPAADRDAAANLPPGTYGQRRDASGKVLGNVVLTYGEEAYAAPDIPADLTPGEVVTVGSKQAETSSTGPSRSRPRASRAPRSRPCRWRRRTARWTGCCAWRHS